MRYANRFQKLRLSAGILISLAGWLHVGNAAPTVIYDTGQTQRLAGYLNITQPQGFAAQQAELSWRAYEVLPDHYPQTVAVPVNTPELSPGRFASMSINLPALERPIFVIGWDTLSAQWLAEHRARLIEIGAVGLVVDVETQAQVTQLQAIVKPLPLYPISGSVLAKTLQMQHYPALVSTTRIEQ